MYYGSSVLRYYPSVALNFSLKDLYRTMLTSDLPTEKPFAKAPSNFLAGATTGCTTLILIYPLDIAHTWLAADIGQTEARQFKGLCHFLKIIYDKDGMKGIYYGLPTSLQGMIVYRGLYFGGFDTAKELMLQKSPHLPFWKQWLAAQVVTTSAGLLSYPLDTVRRCMMMQSGLERQMYNNTWDCWKKIYRMEDMSSFYRRAVSNMFRSCWCSYTFTEVCITLHPVCDNSSKMPQTST